MLIKMKKSILYIIFGIYQTVSAQENVYPAPVQKNRIVLTNGTVHIGNGTVVKSNLIFENGKISSLGELIPNENDKIINCQDKHIYPGLIASTTSLGLIEVGAVRATRDARELGEYNPNIRSIVAYNTDSKVINTVRTNGILLAEIIPSGGYISGTSSIVQLDAWNWEDALYKSDIGLHLHIPNLIYKIPWWEENPKEEEPEYLKKSLAKIQEIKNFFKQAKAYHFGNKKVKNVKFEALKKLFNKEQKLFVHANQIKEMLLAINIAQEIGCELVIVGGTESWRIADVLAQNKVAVILNQPHSLPSNTDEAVDLPYATASALQKAGVVYSICIGDEDGFWQTRTLPFQAGTMAAYGLSKEEALQAITLNPAKIFGIDKVTGTLEIGKDANIVISEGDILDMKTSKITNAFIQGRTVNLDDKQKQLFEKYKYKYGITK